MMVMAAPKGDDARRLVLRYAARDAPSAVAMMVMAVRAVCCPLRYDGDGGCGVPDASL